MTQGVVGAHRRTVRRSSVLPGPVRWGFAVLTWTVMLGCLAVLAVAVVVPRVAGATPWTILTSSMEPGLPPGTLVVDRPVDPAQVGVGDVITYQLVSGEPEVVTHRVVEVSQTLVGDLTFRTRGDANDAVDAAPVLPEQVRGRLWYAVPLVGHAGFLFTGAERQQLVWLVAGGLVLYAVAMFAGSLRERRRGQPDRVGATP